MCIHICTECKTAVGIVMPAQVKAAGIGEQMVWLATQAVEDNQTCLNSKCTNYFKGVS